MTDNTTTKKKHTVRNLLGVAVVAIVGFSACQTSSGSQSTPAPAASASQSAPESTTAATTKPAEAKSSEAPKSASHLTFKVSSKTAKIADVTLTYTNDKGGQVQKQKTVDLPYTQTIDFKRYTIKPVGANILAQAAAGGSDLKASVAWNDDEPSVGEGSGEYATATAMLS